MATILTQVDGAAALSGTGDDTIIVAQHSTGAGVPDPQVLTGGAGDDVIFGDHALLFTDPATATGNSSLATARSIDAPEYWSLAENPDVQNATSVPYTTVLATGDGNADVFLVTVGAGETITLDIDYGNSDSGTGAFDSQLDFFDSLGGLLVSNDDAPATLGASGSPATVARDSFLTFTNPSAIARQYFISVTDAATGFVPLGATYMLNVSVTNHAATGMATFGADDITGGAGDDVIYGVAGDDTIEGGAGADDLDGGSGVDTLSYAGSSASVVVNLADGTATGGDATGDTIRNFENLTGSALSDLLTGSDADDNVIRAGAGNDFLDGRGGADSLFGEAGDDILIAGTIPADLVAGEVFDGGAGSDRLSFVSTSGTERVFDVRASTITNVEKLSFANLTGQSEMLTAQLTVLQAVFSGITTLRADQRDGTGTFNTEFFMEDASFVTLAGLVFENGYGTAFADTVSITGDGDAETIVGTDIADVIDGGDGNDALSGGLGDDVLIGGGGDDTLDGGDGIDTASYADASARVAVFLNRAPADLGGGQGIDTFVSVENVIGTAFSDRLVGDAGDNVLRGGAGNDVLVGLAGDDTLHGEEGDDDLTGSGGNDTLLGGAGADLLVGLGGADVLIGGDGNDEIQAGLGVDLVEGGAGDDEIFGNFGADLLDGGAGDDNIRAGGSGDMVNGGAGNDRMVGGNGKDTLWGGSGNDVYFGGSGTGGGDGLRDTFVFKSFANGGGGFDRIKDFENNIDKIDLSESGYTDATDVLADATQVGADVQINLDFSGIVVIENFLLADLNAGDFLLVV